MSLTTTLREMQKLRADLKAVEESSNKEMARLRSEIASRQTILAQAEDGLDPAKIARALTVIHATDYTRGGEDWKSARQAAINWLASQEPPGGYGSLRYEFFGTKNYDRWSGQRCDCQYGCGPTHGSICFSIGLVKDARERDLTDDEVEAAIYFLIHLERIQDAGRRAKAVA